MVQKIKSALINRQSQDRTAKKIRDAQPKTVRYYSGQTDIRHKAPLRTFKLQAAVPGVGLQTLFLPLQLI